jgi:hypothetical protein
MKPTAPWRDNGHNQFFREGNNLNSSRIPKNVRPPKHYYLLAAADGISLARRSLEIRATGEPKERS